MSTFLIKVKIDDPYPKEFEERAEASHIGSAINRAISKLRKGPLKGKRLKELTVRAICPKNYEQ